MTQDATFRRWKRELDAATKREDAWRKNGQKIYQRYRAADVKKTSFNILWANTEILRPALYNSVPKPDVRRRFRDADPVGKAASEVLERSLVFSIDAYSFDGNIKKDVLDSLLPGRGISRVRYVPTISEAPPAKPTGTKEGQEPATAGVQELEYEQVTCDHVDWQDFRHGFGRTWDEVQWVAFRCKLNKADTKAKFGEDIAKDIKYDLPKDDDSKESKPDFGENEQWSDFWEIWDKAGDKVFFINTGYAKGLIYPTDNPKGEPPPGFKDFFPCPEPLRMVEDSSSLMPIALWEQYAEQAEELNRVSLRINRLIEKIKARGLYDATLAEVASLMSAGETDLIPISAAAKWMNNGGIEKAIWWMPIHDMATVLVGLYDARDRCKQVIYELTGISDIIRGATDPAETLGAQKIKANYGSLRLQRMQREVQRYIRDLLRLMAGVIGEKFQPETLAKMTGLQFPTAEQKQQMTVQIQQQAQQMQQAGQQPTPDQIQQAQGALSMPTWDDVMAVLRDDMEREYRIDVETDSTIQESIDGDMQGLQEVLGAVAQFWTAAGPAVERGALTMDAVKAITLTIVRRARMGLEVEDAIEKGMKQPPPPPDPNAGKTAEAEAKAQATVQAAQVKAQADAQAEQQRLAMEDHYRAQELASQQKMAVFESQLTAQREAMEAQAAEREMLRDQEFQRWKAELEAAVKIEVAEIASKAKIADAATKAATAEVSREVKP